MEGSQLSIRDNSNIKFELNKFDSLNRSDNGALVGNTGKELSEQDISHERQLHTSSGKRHNRQDSSDSAILNI